MTGMRLACSAVLAFSACYAPKLVGGAPCDPAAIDSCPSGQSCVATGGGSGVCTAGGSGPDAGTDSVTTTDGGATCLGKGLLGSVCLSQPPTTAVSLASVTINSSGVGSGGCTELRNQTGGPPLCIISGTSIDIPAGILFRIIAANQSGATSTNPVVLVASKSITIEGTLDIATHVGDVIGGAPVLGAGARTAIGCGASGLDGTQGKPAGNNESLGGGGAAGGSFGSLGGAGGFGGNNNNTAHGNPVAGTIPSNVLLGGCPGGNGGNGNGGTTGAGIGGGGGGAIYLLAGESITVAGKINASGAGGGQGSIGSLSSGGGGGGGSGGMIGLEAPRISVTGSMFANGGGGGAGNGQNDTDTAAPGLDPSAPKTAAPGAIGNDGGGSGGSGSIGTGVGASGQNASGQFPEGGGGGGGGGAGVIHVFGTLSITGTGTVSPPAS